MSKTVSIVLLVVGLLVGAIVGRTAFPRQVVKEVPKEVIKEVPKEVIKEVTKEVPMNLAATAKAIREGKIDVGNRPGMEPDGRLHSIHAVLGLDCAACHNGVSTTAQALFSAQDVSPLSPGPVDTEPCKGCHGAGGPATNFYGPGGP